MLDLAINIPHQKQTVRSLKSKSLIQQIFLVKSIGNSISGQCSNFHPPGKALTRREMMNAVTHRILWSASFDNTEEQIKS